MDNVHDGREGTGEIYLEPVARLVLNTVSRTDHMQARVPVPTNL